MYALIEKIPGFHLVIAVVSMSRRRGSTCSRRTGMSVTPDQLSCELLGDPERRPGI